MSRGLVLLLTQVLRYKAAPASGLWGTHLLCLRLWTGASAFPSPGQKAGRMRGRRTELQQSILQLLEVIEMFIVFYYDDDFMGVYSCQNLLNCKFYIHGIFCM